MLFVLFGGNDRAKQSKVRSRRLKFVHFANDVGALPLLPTKPETLMRYMLWLPSNGVRSGWKGCLQYVTEVSNWNQEHGYGDPRELPGVPFFWRRFRNNYQHLVLAEHPMMKLPLRPAMLEAMALDADLSRDDDLRDLAAYFLFFFTGARIGHCAPPSATASHHAQRFEDICFHPSLKACKNVYICFRSTKTRPRAADLPFWHAISRQERLPFCPVALLRAHFLRAYRQRPDGFLFATPAGNPLPRSTFNTVLRRRLGVAQRRLPVAFDLRRFSGISFWKGCLSLLGSLNVPAYRLADHADHGTVDSSRAYTVDTVNDRAANSDLIGSAFSVGG